MCFTLAIEYLDTTKQTIIKVPYSRYSEILANNPWFFVIGTVIVIFGCSTIGIAFHYHEVSFSEPLKVCII